MKKFLMGVSVALLLGACASKETPKDIKVEDRSPPVTSTTSTTNPPSTQGTQGQQTGTALTNRPLVDPLKDPNNPLSKRVIYFEYDKDAVKGEFASLVQAHAAYLSQNRNRKVRLEGHADERGSREYNMALGQRRADAVRKASAVLGVGNERMETISFGEDKPKSSGHDEAAWAQNRRVEIVYDGE